MVHDAPCSTHLRSVSICCAVNCLPNFFGGILASGSSVSSRSIRSLSSGFPGTTAAPPDLSLASIPSLVSSRKPALRCLSSGPWQAKQFSERTERTSRAKLTGRALDLFWDWTGLEPSVPLLPGVVGPGQADRRDRESHQPQRRESKQRGHSIPLCRCRGGDSNRKPWSDQVIESPRTMGCRSGASRGFALVC